MVTVTKENMAWMAIVLVIVTVVAGVLGSGVISQAQTEELDIVGTKIQKGTNGNALLSVEVKNSGNSLISGLEGQLFFDTNGGVSPVSYYSFAFDPTALSAGMITTYTGEITNSESMIFGESYNVSVNGTLTSGSVLQDTSTVRVGRI